MITCKRFRARDAIIMKVEKKDLLLTSFESVEDLYFSLQNLDCAYTIFHNRDPLCVIWYETFQQGRTLEVHMLTSRKLKTHFNKEVHKCFKNILEGYKIAYSNTVRIQGATENREVDGRFLEFYGFVYEGALKKAHPISGDIYVYALTMDRA